VNIPQHQFFVKHESKSFEESFDHAFDSLLTQIKRKKQQNLQ
jgi:putative sigma-54 modulation protein